MFKYRNVSAKLNIKMFDEKKISIFFNGGVAQTGPKLNIRLTKSVSFDSRKEELLR